MKKTSLSLFLISTLAASPFLQAQSGPVQSMEEQLRGSITENETSPLMMFGGNALPGEDSRKRLENNSDLTANNRHEEERIEEGKNNSSFIQRGNGTTEVVENVTTIASSSSQQRGRPTKTEVTRQAIDYIKTTVTLEATTELYQDMLAARRRLLAEVQNQENNITPHRRTTEAINAINAATEACEKADKAHEAACLAVQSDTLSWEEKKQIYNAAYKEWEITIAAYRTAIAKSETSGAQISPNILAELKVILKDAENQETFWNNQIDKIQITLDQGKINAEKAALEIERRALQEQMEKNNNSMRQEEENLEELLQQLTLRDQALSERETLLDQEREVLAQQEHDLKERMDSALETQKVVTYNNPLLFKQVAEKAEQRNLIKEEENKKNKKEALAEATAARQAIVENKKAEISELIKKWRKPTQVMSFSSSGDTALGTWKSPAATEAREALSLTLEKMWGHLAGFQMIDAAKEVAHYPSFFEAANRAYKMRNEMSMDGRTYRGNQYRDDAIRRADEKVQGTKEEAIKTCTDWMTSELHQAKEAGASFPVTASALFEMRFKHHSSADGIGFYNPTTPLREAYIKAVDNVWPGVIQAETEREQRLFQLQDDLFKASDQAWDEFIKSPQVTEEDRHTPSIAAQKEKVAREKKEVAITAEAEAQKTYAAALHQEALNASKENQYVRAAEGAWAGMIHQSAQAVTGAFNHWQQVSERFVNTKDKSLMEYDTATRALERSVAIAEAHLAAWKASWSDEFQKQEAAQAREYQKNEMSKIEADQYVHQLGVNVEQAQKKYQQTFEQAKRSAYQDATKYAAVITDLKAFKEARIAFEKAKVVAMKHGGDASQLATDRNQASNKVREMWNRVLIANALLNQIMPLCNNHLATLSGIDEAKKQLVKIRADAIDSPTSTCRSKFDHNRKIQTLVTQKETAAATILASLRKITDTSIDNAASAWNWAYQNIVAAHYNLAVAEVELEVIVSKLAKLASSQKSR